MRRYIDRPRRLSVASRRDAMTDPFGARCACAAARPDLWLTFGLPILGEIPSMRASTGAMLDVIFGARRSVASSR